MSFEELGRVFLIERRKQHLKQSELIEKTGFSPSFISRLENGKVPDLTINKLFMICDALNIQVTLSCGTKDNQQFVLENTQISGVNGKS